MNKRIWELDALRGLCLIGVVAIHFLFDLTELYGILQWDAPAWFSFLQDWGGVIFLLISGICVTLGSRSVRRGLVVLGCGLLINAVTWAMYAFLDFHKSVIIYFGVLHCLGICMILWPLFKKCPSWLLGLLSVALIGVGFWADGQIVQTHWLIPLGFTFQGFSTADYFPLLPHLGFFLLGSVLGKTLYAKKQTLFPKTNENSPVFRFLRACGRSSLWIYLLHQPILTGICLLLAG